MVSYRSATQWPLTIVLAFALCACNFESSEDQAVGGPISLSISSPTSLSSMDTTDASVSLSGSASSENGVHRVTWTTDRGGQGVASGAETWQIANVDLELGQNEITVTAEDAAGMTADRSITVNRESKQNGSVSLSWNAPTAREDGTPLTNLAGHKIYYGRMSEIYDYQIDVDSPGISTYVVENLVPGEWYFALAAYDTEGLESDRSNEVARQVE